MLTPLYVGLGQLVVGIGLESYVKILDGLIPLGLAIIIDGRIKAIDYVHQVRE